jgi:methyl-accepting chemotaxis protein
MSTKKSLRFPIFFKILLACCVLAALLVGGSFWFAKRQLEQQPRPNFLKFHFDRYLRFEQSVGEAIGGTVRLVAGDEHLVAALVKRRGVEPGVPDASDAQVAAIASARLEAMRDAMATMLRTRDPEAKSAPKPSRIPDVMIVVDAAGRPLFQDAADGFQLGKDDAAAIPAVKEILRGGGYSGKVVVHDGQALSAVGAPIQDADGTALGAIFVGIRLARFYVDWRAYSDEQLDRQQRLVLVDDRQVVESTFRDNPEALFKAVTLPEKKKVPSGAQQLEVIDFENVLWQFYSTPVAGIGDAGPTEKLGTVYILRARTDTTQERQQEGLWFAAALGMGLAVLIAFGLAFIVTRPIRRVVEATRQIARGQGDLTRRIELSGNDELTDLAGNINRVFENLHRVAQDVQEASMHISSVSAELSAVSRSMNDGAKSQSEKVADAAARVYELSRSVGEVATNAADATSAAKKADEAVAQADRKMGQIRRSSEDARRHMQELGESVRRIGNIVEVIQQISEQTSMLALNASIEAAHAGEQGRGFAVVADEVSSLAKRVGQSARDIEERIATIREQTSDAVRKMEDGSREVEEGTALVTGTLSNLKNISDAVLRTGREVDEQARVSDDVSRDVDEVKRFANEVLASSEQVLSEGDRLHRLAEQLTHSVSGFRTTEAPNGGSASGSKRIAGKADGSPPSLAAPAEEDA